jgi:transglutaminase/protease-like cytokinesis protein 3
MFKTSKILLLFFHLSAFLFFSFKVTAQNEKINFSKIDSYAKSIKGINDIGKLSKKLTAPFKTDLEKTRSIFRWITENIAYDTKEYHVTPDQSSYTKLFNTIDINKKNIYELYDEKIATYVLKNKKGICAGYAALFKALCDSSKIKAEIVNGKAKNSTSQIGTAFKENHAWNAVYLDDKWQLVDVTWASGSCNDSVTMFIKKYDDSYFLTPPNKLILNHYPTDAKWFLMKNVPSEVQFYSYPLIFNGYFQNDISSFYPINGVIEGKTGSKISFEIRSPTSDFDVSVGTKTGSNEVKIKKQEKITTYEYTVTSDKEDVLTIYLNHEAIFDYRIIAIPPN